MDFIDVLFLIAIWTFPFIILTKKYLKMNKKEREEFRHELKKPSIFLGIGIPTIGLLLIFSKFFSGINTLGYIGAIILSISCFATGIEGAIKKERSFLGNASLMLWGLITIVAYIYVM